MKCPYCKSNLERASLLTLWCNTCGLWFVIGEIMKGKCEVFDKGRCFGCEALARDDLDKLKKLCETYKEETNG